MNSTNGPTLEMWNSLRRSLPESSNEYSSLPILINGDSQTGIQIAMAFDGSPHLLVPMSSPQNYESPLSIQLNGLTITEKLLNLGQGPKSFIDATAEPSNIEMFNLVAKEIVKQIILHHGNPRQTCINVVTRWKKFWANNSKPLGYEQILGIFGELYFINNILIPTTDANRIQYWRGPHGERHDFQCENWHLEVKSSSKLNPIVRIHGHDQLIPPYGKDLLLFFLAVSKESGSKHCIESESNSIREHLKHNLDLLNYFEDSLAESGWGPAQEDIHFNIKRADIYVVDKGFPTIGLNNLPTGITQIDYNIDLNLASATDSKIWKTIIKR